MDHQIHTLLKVSLENIKEMIDVNTVVGDPIISNETMVIPISKVKMGFLAGGSEMKNDGKEQILPFGGGTGGSVLITPVAFLVCYQNDIKVLHLEEETHLYEAIIDKIPKMIEDVIKLFKNNSETREG